MYKRLVILSVIIVTALCALVALGYHSIRMWAQGMEGTRLGQFAEAAEQIRYDVKRKLDAFMEQEQNRPYTHYQYFYVPDDTDSDDMQAAVFRSPLGDQITNGLAYGNFQVNSDGSITTPYYNWSNQEEIQVDRSELYAEVVANTSNVRANVLPMLADGMLKPSVGEPNQQTVEILDFKRDFPEQELSDMLSKAGSAGKMSQKALKGGNAPGMNYMIESLQNPEQRAQVLVQKRSVVERNIASGNAGGPPQTTAQEADGFGRELLERGASSETQSRRYAGAKQDAPGTSGSSQPALTRRDAQASSGPEGPPTHAATDGYRYESGPQTKDEPNVASQADGQAIYLPGPQDAAGLRNLPGKPKTQGGMRPETAKEDSKSEAEPDRLAQDARRTEALEHELTIEGFDGSDASYSRIEPNNAEIPSAATRQRNAAETREPQGERQSAPKVADTETVKIEIDPFVPLVVPEENGRESIFDGQVFMLRRVHIEDQNFLQGFQLNEKMLLDEVRRSAENVVSLAKGMTFELSKRANQQSAYTAVLDFGFGDLVLNLIETDPGRIPRQIAQQRTWYLGIVTLVLTAVALGLISLWRNASAQLKLAQKKDDFISAVSHELRTPLTSIRMYAEMLDKNWIKSQDKRAEYYKNMRQESERLSRLIENVLDFSRIQRNRKKYTFTVGDFNRCVSDVVDMMAPYAAQNGFSIETQLGALGPSGFDPDAVTQIVVNLLDNAIKYARNAEDRTIVVRTKGNNGFIVIEVEDHGPGVPHRQREKVFEEFYRIGAEATRETVGTGLGLALVKRFAQAHNGFVEIISAKPTGAIFRVGLAPQV